MSASHAPVEGNMVVSNAEFGHPDAYVAKKELGPYSEHELKKQDLSPRMGEGVV